MRKLGHLNNFTKVHFFNIFESISVFISHTKEIARLIKCSGYKILLWINFVLIGMRTTLYGLDYFKVTWLVVGFELWWGVYEGHRLFVTGNIRFLSNIKWLASTLLPSKFVLKLTVLHSVMFEQRQSKDVLWIKSYNKMAIFKIFFALIELLVLQLFLLYFIIWSSVFVIV